MLTGAIAATLTPLRGDGLDGADAFGSVVDFLAGSGLDGILALGTTGEGLLLTREERMRAAGLFVEAAGGRIAVAIHCGAQTTADTVALAAHAADAGADAVAVIGPPYFPLDAAALLAHFEAAARACAPLPFYLYEFRARAGYSIPLETIAALRERVDNLVGIKVSNRPLESVEPYLRAGLDGFVGAEDLLVDGLRRGAAGAVSGLAAVFPEVVVQLVRTRDPDVAARAAELRRGLERFPFHAAAKLGLARRGVAIRPDVRPPLRGLDEHERAELERWLASS